MPTGITELLKVAYGQWLAKQNKGDTSFEKFVQVMASSKCSAACVIVDAELQRLVLEKQADAISKHVVSIETLEAGKAAIAEREKALKKERAQLAEDQQYVELGKAVVEEEKAAEKVLMAKYRFTGGPFGPFGPFGFTPMMAYRK